MAKSPTIAMIYSMHTYLQNTLKTPHFSLQRSVPKLLLILICLCPQSGPGSHHSRYEKVLWRQSLLFPAAVSEQVGHTLCVCSSATHPVSLCCRHRLPASHAYVPSLSVSGTSTTLVGCCQAPSKWTAVLCSSTRSSFHHYPTSRQEEVSFTQNIPFTINSLHCSYGNA